MIDIENTRKEMLSEMCDCYSIAGNSRGESQIGGLAFDSAKCQW